MTFARTIFQPVDCMDAAWVRRRLLDWFARHHRELPWRNDRDPYRIWVSEVMLQQTTVAAVIPRFCRFLTIFPDIKALAAADEQQVLREWEGLGYYRRARDLHRAARLLVENHGARLPDDPEVWKQLPGVGRYILGAVLSQAFERRLPIVEANSQRVLCRLFRQEGDSTSGPVKKWLWQAAEFLLPRKRVGDFNQALMELGALVCTSTAPRCAECPLSKACRARESGLQDTIPAKPARNQIEAVEEIAVVVRNRTRLLLVQRPATGRWANMWEFPHVQRHEKEDPADAAMRLLMGMKAKIGQEIMTIRHSVTRFRITMVCLEAIYRSGKLADERYSQTRWVEPAELRSFPVSTPQRKLAETIMRTSRQLRLF